MRTHRLLMLCLVLFLGLIVSGCATTERKEPYRLSDRGTLIWEDEFEFKVPPANWKVVQVESGGEFGFGFMKIDPGPFPSQSMFVYDEEPFGAAIQLEDRAKEFFKRFLWTAALKLQILQREKVQVAGGEGLAVTVEGKDSASGEKAKSKVVFGKRGERVVAWYITQWRPMDGIYDQTAFETFDEFWKSFKFLKKSFYEML